VYPTTAAQRKRAITAQTARVVKQRETAGVMPPLTISVFAPGAKTLQAKG
jgi:hypothetical protein